MRPMVHTIIIKPARHSLVIGRILHLSSSQYKLTTFRHVVRPTSQPHSSQHLSAPLTPLSTSPPSSPSPSCKPLSSQSSTPTATQRAASSSTAKPAANARMSGQARRPLTRSTPSGRSVMSVTQKGKLKLLADIQARRWMRARVNGFVRIVSISSRGAWVVI
jgi:tRNA threonylcarbamoyladenosine modification (KEOPS) complex  Pcc1 subunit